MLNIQEQNSGKLAPGPGLIAFLGAVVRNRKQSLHLFQELFETYGKNVFFRFGSIPYLFTQDEKLIEAICLDRENEFIKGNGYENLHPIMGKGLFTANQEQWEKSRKISKPAFHRDRYAPFLKTIEDSLKRRLDVWERDGTKSVLLLSEMNELTLEIICRALFGQDLGDHLKEITDAVTVLVHESVYQRDSFFRAFDMIPGLGTIPVSHWLYHHVPTPSLARFRKACKVIEDTALEIIQRRKKSGELGDDLLSRYLGETSDEIQIRDEVMTMILVGHETTATALTWLFMELSRNPKWVDAIREESKDALSESPLSFEMLSAQKSMQAVWSETLRLYPPLWRFSRQVFEEKVVAGVRIPKGTVMAVFPYCNHRDPKFWNDPNTFMPERFMKGPDTSFAKFAYIPFGHGVRFCIGKYFALMEALVIVPRILERYDLKVENIDEIQMDPKISLRPNTEVKTTLIRRTAGARVQ